MEETLQTVGSYAFLVGLLVAIIAGVVVGYGSSALGETAGLVTFVLVVMGLIVGFVNIKDKEVQHFLIAAIALLSMNGANALIGIDNVSFLASIKLGSMLTAVVGNIATFVAPAALVLAIMAVYQMAKGA